MEITETTAPHRTIDITLRKSTLFAEHGFTRYEVLADGESIGWAVKDSAGEWGGKYRNLDGTTWAYCPQATRRDAVDVICRKALCFFDYGRAAA